MSVHYGNVLNSIDLFSILHLLWPPAKKPQEEEVCRCHNTGCEGVGAAAPPWYSHSVGRHVPTPHLGRKPGGQVLRGLCCPARAEAGCGGSEQSSAGLPSGGASAGSPGGALGLGHPGEDLRSGAGAGHADGGAEDPRGPGRAGLRTRAKSSGVGALVLGGWEAGQSGPSARSAAR